MKSKVLLFTVMSTFLVLVETGCKNDPEIKDTCVFNIDNPINDLEWLKVLIPTTTSPDYFITFYLYQNKKDSNKFFFLEENINNVLPEYSKQTIFNCKGDKIMLKGIETPPTEEWSQFFEENFVIKQIWPIKKV